MSMNQTEYSPPHGIVMLLADYPA